MFLRRMNPTLPFGDLRREIDRLFDDFGAPFAGALPTRAESFPAVNVWDNADAIFVEAEVPGLKMSDLELTVIGNELSIRGERKPCCNDGATGRSDARQSCSAEPITVHRRERGAGPFTRFVTLPVPVETSRVEAVLRDGVLTVTLPKAAEAKPRRIAVQAS